MIVAVEFVSLGVFSDQICIGFGCQLYSSESVRNARTDHLFFEREVVPILSASRMLRRRHGHILRASCNGLYVEVAESMLQFC